jgi:hypothetical protein
MLRASVRKLPGEQRIQLRAVVDDDIDPGLPHGVELRKFATAVVTGRALDAARDSLARTAGPETAAAAAGVCANFEMMNRILDAVGCPVPKRTREISTLLGLPAEH